MPIKIIADSCCDTTQEIRQKLDLDLVPLILKVPARGEILDRPDIDTEQLCADMGASTEPVRTACPSIDAYMQAMAPYDECCIVTLSSKLSGSNNAAHVAKDELLRTCPGKKIHVFDSQSAAAGELLIALQIDELRAQGTPFDTLVEKVEAFIQSMRTLFVLEDLKNLVKNGRMSKVKGIVASVLSIHPVFADNGSGEIALLHTVRGLANSYAKLIASVTEFLAHKAEKSISLVITQCLCGERAQKIKDRLQSSCKALRDIVIVPASGLSTVYANKGGIVLAFNPQ